MSGWLSEFSWLLEVIQYLSFVYNSHVQVYRNWRPSHASFPYMARPWCETPLFSSLSSYLHFWVKSSYLVRNTECFVLNFRTKLYVVMSRKGNIKTYGRGMGPYLVRFCSFWLRSCAIANRFEELNTSRHNSKTIVNRLSIFLQQLTFRLTSQVIFQHPVGKFLLKIFSRV